MAEVYLHVYDLTGGFIKEATRSLAGCDVIEGIWHGAIYVHGREFDYGPDGIRHIPKDLMDGQVCQKFYLGETEVEIDTLLTYLYFLNETKFQGEKYNFFSYNCLFFADFLAKELVGSGIPEHFLYLSGTITKKIAKFVFQQLLYRGKFQILARLLPGTF